MLDDGVDLNINGRLINFHGTITIVSADNLASWNLGGYKNLASATRKCRFCMAAAKHMHSKDFISTHVKSFHTYLGTYCIVHLLRCLLYQSFCVLLYSFLQMILNLETVTLILTTVLT